MKLVIQIRITLILFAYFFAQLAFAELPGASIYSSKCVLCHGAQGAGDGPVGKALSPQPKDFAVIFKKYKTSDSLNKFILNALQNPKPGSPMHSFSKMSARDKQEVADYLVKKF